MTKFGHGGTVKELNLCICHEITQGYIFQGTMDLRSNNRVRESNIHNNDTNVVPLPLNTFHCVEVDLSMGIMNSRADHCLSIAEIHLIQKVRRCNSF